MKKTIVLRIGNPYLKDDRIGLKIVEELEVFFRNKKDVTFDFYYSSGIELLDSILDYEVAIFIDSIVSEEVGKISYLTLEDILLFPENPSVHSANFTTMIKLGMKISPNRMPNQILFCAIGIYDPFTFSDEFSSILQETYADILEELKEKINSLTT